MTKLFIGYSNAEFTIKNKENSTIVVKKYSDLDSFKRAVIGIENLEKLELKSFLVQKIIKKYIEFGHGVIEYNYIKGSDLSLLISKMSVENTANFFINIENYFNEIRNLNENNNEFEINQEIEQYINRVNLLIIKYGINNDNFNLKTNNILRQINRKIYYKTSCHGDFSLSNIILDNKGYNLIDALDVSYGHYYLDYCRLRLDTKHMLYSILPIKKRVSTFEKFSINNNWSRLESALGFNNGDIQVFHYLSILRILRFAIAKKDDFLIKYLLNIG